MSSNYYKPQWKLVKDSTEIYPFEIQFTPEINEVNEFKATVDKSASIQYGDRLELYLGSWRVATVIPTEIVEYDAYKEIRGYEAAILLSWTKFSKDQGQADKYDVFYSGIQADQILADILSGTEFSIGSCPTDTVTIEFDNLSRLDCIKKLAKKLGYDWWVDGFKVYIGVKGSSKGSVSDYKVERHKYDYSSIVNKIYLRRARGGIIVTEDGKDYVSDETSIQQYGVHAKTYVASENTDDDTAIAEAQSLLQPNPVELLDVRIPLSEIERLQLTEGDIITVEGSDYRINKFTMSRQYLVRMDLVSVEATLSKRLKDLQEAVDSHSVTLTRVFNVDEVPDSLQPKNPAYSLGTESKPWNDVRMHGALSKPMRSEFASSGSGTWQYYVPLTVTNNSGFDVSDEAVHLQFTVPAADAQYMKGYSSGNLGDDYRFATDTAMQNVLSHWLLSATKDSGTGDVTVDVYVRIPSLPNGSNTTIYFFYGNDSATSTSSKTDTLRYGTDLLLNSSFESWTGGIPDYWTKGGTATLQQSTTAKTGSYSALFQLDNNYGTLSPTIGNRTIWPDEFSVAFLGSPTGGPTVDISVTTSGGTYTASSTVNASYWYVKTIDLNPAETLSDIVLKASYSSVGDTAFDDAILKGYYAYENMSVSVGSAVATSGPHRHVYDTYPKFEAASGGYGFEWYYSGSKIAELDSSGNLWVAGNIGSGGTVETSFLNLSDTPSSYSGYADALVKVKATEDGLNFIKQGSGNGLDADMVDGHHASDFALAGHTHTRSEVTDFWSTPFWSNIPDKPSTYPPEDHTHPASDVTSGTFSGGSFTFQDDSLSVVFRDNAGSNKVEITVSSLGTASVSAKAFIIGSYSLNQLDADNKVPYATQADDSDKVDGYDASAFAMASHTHDASDITSGVLAEARIPHTWANDFTLQNSAGVSLTVTDDGTTNITTIAHDGISATGNINTDGKVIPAGGLQLGSYVLSSLAGNNKVVDSDKLDGYHKSDLDSLYASASHTHPASDVTAGTFGGASYTISNDAASFTVQDSAGNHKTTISATTSGTQVSTEALVLGSYALTQLDADNKVPNATNADKWGGKLRSDAQTIGGNVTIGGTLQVNGNKIYDSGASERIALGSTIGLYGDVSITGKLSVTELTPTLVTFDGDVKIKGNDIQDSNGTVRITFDPTNDNIQFKTSGGGTAMKVWFSTYNRIDFTSYSTSFVHNGVYLSIKTTGANWPFYYIMDSSGHYLRMGLDPNYYRYRWYFYLSGSYQEKFNFDDDGTAWAATGWTSCLTGLPVEKTHYDKSLLELLPIAAKEFTKPKGPDDINATVLVKDPDTGELREEPVFEKYITPEGEEHYHIRAQFRERYGKNISLAALAAAKGLNLLIALLLKKGVITVDDLKSIGRRTV